MQVGQGSGSSEHMGGYDLFIFLLCFIFQILYVSVVLSCCFAIYLVFVTAIRYIICLHVSIVLSSRFIYGCLSVSVVLFSRFTCCLMFIAVMRYMCCLVVMFYILYFHVFNNDMLHMLIDHMFQIAINMFDIIISMINNLLYVIIIWN
jgi:hypothetical protein